MFNAFCKTDWRHGVQSFLIIFCILVTAKDLFIDKEFLKSFQTLTPSTNYFQYYSVKPVFDDDTSKTITLKNKDGLIYFDFESDVETKKEGFMSWQDTLRCFNGVRYKKFPPQEWPKGDNWEGVVPKDRNKSTWAYFSEMPIVNSKCTMCGTIYFKTLAGQVKTHNYCATEPFNLIVE